MEAASCMCGIEFWAWASILIGVFVIGAAVGGLIVSAWKLDGPQPIVGHPEDGDPWPSRERYDEPYR